MYNRDENDTWNAVKFQPKVIPAKGIDKTPKYQFAMLSVVDGESRQLVHVPLTESRAVAEVSGNSGPRPLAETIVLNTPASADQTAAIRLIREAVMTANAAIACDGK